MRKNAENELLIKITKNDDFFKRNINLIESFKDDFK